MGSLEHVLCVCVCVCVCVYEAREELEEVYMYKHSRYVQHLFTPTLNVDWLFLPPHTVTEEWNHTRMQTHTHTGGTWVHLPLVLLHNTCKIMWPLLTEGGRKGGQRECAYAQGLAKIHLMTSLCPPLLLNKCRQAVHCTTTPMYGIYMWYVTSDSSLYAELRDHEERFRCQAAT